MTNIKKVLRKFKLPQIHSENIHSVVIALAIVMIRRGLWGILDKFLFPNHELISYIISITLGILILLFDDKDLDELKSH